MPVTHRSRCFQKKTAATSAEPRVQNFFTTLGGEEKCHVLVYLYMAHEAFGEQGVAFSQL